MTEESFKNNYELYFEPIRKYIFYRSGDAELATDITQETFLTLWRKQINSANIKPLLYKIAGDLYVNHVRKNKLAQSYATEFKLQFSELEDDNEENNELKTKLELLLKQMPEKQRVVFLMSKMEGYTYKEIAAALQIGVKAVEKRMSTALTFLRSNIQSFTNLIYLVTFSALN